MNQEFRIPSEGESAAGEEYEIASSALRPFGLCKGEFTVPDDFNDPLPEDELDLWDAPLSSPAEPYP